MRPSNARFDFCHDVAVTEISTTALAISPNGKWLATGSDDSKLRLWSLPMGRQVATFSNHMTETTEPNIVALAFSPNGKWLVSGDSSGKKILWSVKDIKMRKALQETDSSFLKQMAFTPNGKYLITVDWDSIKMWVIPRGKLKKEFGKDTIREGFAISPDGSYLATANVSIYASNQIELWSLKKGEVGKLIKKFGTYGMKAPRVFAFSPNGKYLVTGKGSGDRNVRVWKMPSGKLKKAFEPHENSGCEGLAFDAKGKVLATTGGIDPPEIWSFPKIKKMQTLGKVGVTQWYGDNVVFWPGQEKVIVDYYWQGAVRIWDYKTGKLFRCLIDIEETIDKKRGRTYEYRDESGQTVQVTFPDCQCAPPPPAGSKCVCNTVKGKISTGGGCGIVYYYPS